MSRSLISLVFGIAVLTIGPFAFGQTDVEGSKDYPGISRMPGYYIYDYRDTPYDSYDFKVAKADSWEQKTVEGTVTIFGTTSRIMPRRRANCRSCEITRTPRVPPVGRSCTTRKR